MASNTVSCKSTNQNPRNNFLKPHNLQTNPRRFAPFTPTNSPSDFPRRSSVGKESVVGENDEKENERDENLRGSKLKSPKVSKNFMSPTISAASKFTPSPKKKILVERNDPVRTSISLSSGKATLLSSINVSQELDLNSVERNLSDKHEAVVEVPPIPKPPKTGTFSNLPSNSNPESELSESVVTDSVKEMKIESVLKNSVSSYSSIAPLDADPYVAPYDPKTNYMSPRPKFLYYKPNSRVEALLQDGYLAEIMSDSFSENESTEGSLNDNADDMVNEEVSEVNDSAEVVNDEVSEVNDSAEMVNAEVSEVNENADMVLGLEEVMESFPAIQTENMVQKRKKKGFSKLVLFSVVLMFLMACVLSVSLSRSGSLNRFVLSDLSNYYQELNIANSAKAGFETLAGHVNEFSSEMSNYYQESNVSASAETVFEIVCVRVNEVWVNTKDLISKLIKRPSDGKTLGPLKFMNLTYQETNIWDDGIFMNNHVQAFGDIIVEDVVEEELEEFEDDVLEEFDSGENNEKEMIEFDEDELEEDDVDTEIEVVSNEKEVDSQADVVESEAVSSDSEIEVVSYEKGVNSQAGVIESEAVSSDPVLVSENSQDQLTVTFQDQGIEVEAEKIDATAETSVVQRSPVSSSTEDAQSSFKSEPATEKPENNLVYTTMISSLLAALLPAIAFLYQKYKNSSSTNVIVQQTHPLLSKQEKTVSQNWQQTQVEESCHSEMSSFSSAFYRKKEEPREDDTEAQSYEGKQQQRRIAKRESLASSSGSPSYGSFTSYERIPIKHGEDEIITPVRRSSRIRKHAVTSP